MIFAHQCELGNTSISNELFEQWEKIAFYQRAFNDSDSPLYKSIENMRGFCKHEKGESVAPKESPTAQLFVALTKINQNHFTSEQGAKIISELYNKSKLTFKQVRKILELPDDYKFYELDYKKDDAENKTFYAFSGYHKLNKFTDDLDLMDKIIEIIATQKTEDAIKGELGRQNILPEFQDEIKKLTSSTFIKISIKALKKLIPGMQRGLTYDKACIEPDVNYDPRDTGESFIIESDTAPLKGIDFEKLGNRITSPVVKRTLAQFRKVYNAMVRKYGAPDLINLEVGRELKKSPDERAKLTRVKNENEKINKELAEKYGEKNVLRWKLYTEQDSKCPYCGATLDINNLGAYEIDHILPYSRSLDNSYNNKVLVCAHCNQAKTNKTPFEWIGETGWYDFTIRTNTIFKNPRKREKLLNRTFIDNENEFIARNACDNATIANFVSKYLKDGAGLPTEKIQARNGSLTSFLRHQWGLEKNREESDTHHAQDAVVIACATNGMVKFLQTWSGKMGTDAAYRIKNKKIFAEPWDGFRNELTTKKSEIFVSRPPRKSATGQIHKETIIKNNTETNPKNDKFIVRHGIADRGALFRFDIFKTKDKFVCSPVYTSDLICKDDNKFIPKDSEFVMTLHKDDYVKIQTKNGTFEGYIEKYTTSDQLEIYNHDNSKSFMKQSDIVKINDIVIIDDTNYKIIKFDDNKNKIIVENMKNSTVMEIDGKLQYYKGKVKKEIKLSQKYYQPSSDKKQIAIGTVTNLIKYNVDILGNMTEVRSETREPVCARKSGAQKFKDKKERKQLKGVHNGLAHPSPHQTV